MAILTIDVLFETCLGLGSYLALGHEYACRGLYLHAALVLEQPNHYSLHVEASPCL